LPDTTVVLSDFFFKVNLQYIHSKKCCIHVQWKESKTFYAFTLFEKKFDHHGVYSFVPQNRFTNIICTQGNCGHREPSEILTTGHQSKDVCHSAELIHCFQRMHGSKAASCLLWVPNLVVLRASTGFDSDGSGNQAATAPEWADQ
jgi:hypothetical protein